MKKDLRIFGLILGAILAVIGIRLFYKAHNNIWLYLTVVGGIFAAVALVFPLALQPVYKIWMRVARTIGWFNTIVILSLFFYVLFMPIGLIMRIFRRDLLGLKIEKRASSYWINQPPGPTALGQYEKQF